MSHTIANKPRLLARVRRIRGQVEAIERALEKDAECAEVLMLAASVRGAINGLTVELIEDHVREHVADPQLDAAAVRTGADELISVLRSYLK